MWLLLVAAGAAMQVVSVVWLVRLRPDEPYPMWTYVPKEPGRVRAVRIGGASLILFGAIMFSSSLGPLWFLTPIAVALAFVPMFVAIYVVNGSFERRAASAAGPTE